jgi:hypothetical protein
MVFVVPRRLFRKFEEADGGLPVRGIDYLRDLRFYGVQGSSTAEVRGKVVRVSELQSEFARMPRWPTSYREIVNARQPRKIVTRPVILLRDSLDRPPASDQWYDILRIVLQNRSDDMKLVDLLRIGAVCRTWNHAVQDSPQAWGRFMCDTQRELALTDWRAASLSTRFISWSSDPRRLIDAVRHTMPLVYELINQMGRGCYNKISKAVKDADPCDAIACVAGTYCYGVLEDARFAEGIDIIQKGATWSGF